MGCLFLFSYAGLTVISIFEIILISKRDLVPLLDVKCKTLALSYTIAYGLHLDLYVLVDDALIS